MTVQPQLFLLQKTLLYVESLGKKLYPELDLWQTAKPLLTRWIKRQYRFTQLAKSAIKDWHAHAEPWLKMPHLAFSVLQTMQTNQLARPLENTNQTTKHALKKRYFLMGMGMTLLGSAIVTLVYSHHLSLISLNASLIAFVASMLT